MIRRLFRPASKVEVTPDLYATLFCMQIIDHHFGLTENDRNRIINTLPENIRVLANTWVMFYLGWLFRLKVQTIHGSEFTDSTFIKVSKLFIRMSEEDTVYSQLNENLTFCFKQMDECIPKATEGTECPFELYVAQYLITLDPNSPEYGQTELSESVKSLAIALVEAKVICSDYIHKISTVEKL
jgi:hypothetical protein